MYPLQARLSRCLPMEVTQLPFGSSLPCSWANEGFLGVGLADLVRGPMKLVLASNYMMDFKWLLSACPDLRNAQRLLLVHGERAGSAA